jgi:hypothetical protein
MEDTMYYEDDDDIDIDVCQSCGGYYGLTEGLIELWRKLYNPKPKDVMPQLCYKCIQQ